MMHPSFYKLRDVFEKKILLGKEKERKWREEIYFSLDLCHTGLGGAFDFIWLISVVKGEKKTMC